MFHFLAVFVVLASVSLSQPCKRIELSPGFFIPPAGCVNLGTSSVRVTCQPDSKSLAFYSQLDCSGTLQGELNDQSLDANDTCETTDLDCRYDFETYNWTAGDPLTCSTPVGKFSIVPSSALGTTRVSCAQNDYLAAEITHPGAPAVPAGPRTVLSFYKVGKCHGEFKSTACVGPSEDLSIPMMYPGYGNWLRVELYENSEFCMGEVIGKTILIPGVCDTSGSRYYCAKGGELGIRVAYQYDNCTGQQTDFDYVPYLSSTCIPGLGKFSCNSDLNVQPPMKLLTRQSARLYRFADAGCTQKIMQSEVSLGVCARDILYDCERYDRLLVRVGSCEENNGMPPVAVTLSMNACTLVDNMYVQLAAYCAPNPRRRGRYGGRRSWP